MEKTTGSIRQRGRDSWELRVYLGIDPVTRRERWATKSVRGTRRYSSVQLREFHGVASNGRVGAGTVADLLERWRLVASPGWAVTTQRETKSVVEHHLVPHLGHLRVAKLTTADIDDFYAHLLKRGGRDEQPLAPGTVLRVHVVLHRALAQAVRWDWIWVNPAREASPPRPVPAEICPPSPTEVCRLLTHLASTDPAFHLFLLLAATTGARRGELLGLRAADVDLETGEIAIQRALTEGPDGPVLAPTKTRRSHRVALDAVTVDAVRRYLDSKVANGVPADGPAFIFSMDRADARPWQPSFATKAFIRYREAVGGPHFRLHDLRHFMATQMLDAGVPVAVVSGRLGHARASTTLNVYGHAVPGSDRRAAETLARRLVTT
jgi:integrase